MSTAPVGSGGVGATSMRSAVGGDASRFSSATGTTSVALHGRGGSFATHGSRSQHTSAAPFVPSFTPSTHSGGTGSGAVYYPPASGGGGGRGGYDYGSGHYGTHSNTGGYHHGASGSQPFYPSSGRY